jgi:hypothetical protein
LMGVLLCIMSNKLAMISSSKLVMIWLVDWDLTDRGFLASDYWVVYCTYWRSFHYWNKDTSIFYPRCQPGAFYTITFLG